MTNLDHYRHWLQDIESPDSFIDWSFRFMVSSALQRRVWTPMRNTVLFPNLYLFLVADPGIGKGMVLKPVKELLSYHRWYDKGPWDEETIYRKLTGEHPPESDDGEAVVMRPEKGSAQGAKKDLPLFVLGPDATTYQQLIQDMAGSGRPVRFNVTLPDGTVKSQIITHNSFAFTSTELGSLIRKGSDDIVNFMLEAYDCSDKYEYRTKNNGKDCVHRMCLNFAAGTTPEYMARTFDDSLLNEGMAARSFFIFAFEKRFYRMTCNGLGENQLRSKAKLLSWLRELSKLYGEVRLTPEAYEHFKFWYEKIHPTHRPNKDPKMIHYYGRKDLHVMKTAMALHFSDSLEMTIGIETIQSALDLLEEAEKRMHLALQVGAKNPLANIARKIVRYFVAGGNEAVEYPKLVEAFYNEARAVELAEVIGYMVTTGKLVMTQDKGKQWYRLHPSRLAEEQIETRSDVPFVEARQVVHPSLDKGIRWGQKGKVLLPKGLPAEEIAKLRQLVVAGEIVGMTGFAWEK